MAGGLFVTGTGTGVGKTVVAAVLAHGAVEEGLSVGVFKPAVSGLDQGGEPDHELLARASRSGQAAEEIAPYRYGPGVSPHLAAEMTGEAVDPERVKEAAAAAGEGVELLVCEGVGGLLVPLTAGYQVRDLARDLGYPVVIAAQPGLGTINHTLLTIEAIRAVGLEVRAAVLTPWPEPAGALEHSNLATIAGLGSVEALTLPLVNLDDPGSWPSLPLP